LPHLGDAETASDYPDGFQGLCSRIINGPRWTAAYEMIRPDFHLVITATILHPSGVARNKTGKVFRFRLLDVP
jgi:hypothetical protein